MQIYAEQKESAPQNQSLPEHMGMLNKNTRVTNLKFLPCQYTLRSFFRRLLACDTLSAEKLLECPQPENLHEHGEDVAARFQKTARC